MRITSHYLVNNFKLDQQKVNEELKKVTEQISSGKKIQNMYDDPAVYDDTLRLDTHINDLKAIQERTRKGQHFAQATDDTLQAFDSSLRTFKNELIRAANDSLNMDNRASIAAALEREKAHMITLANTQIEGQYIFSGSATATKPIDERGIYHGNGEAIETVVGEGVKERYNIDGVSLFLGIDENVHKEVTTNVPLKNSTTDLAIKADEPLSALTGNETDDFTFTIAGRGHDGKVVNSTVTLGAGESVQKLLDEIGTAFGNTPQLQKVDVSLDENGTIVVTDRQKGISALELKLKGSQNGENIDFIKNDYTLADSTNSDSAYFVTKGDHLEGNIALVANGAVADDRTKLSDITAGSLDKKSYKMDIKDINGTTQTVAMHLDNNGSSFEIGGKSYTIYSADGTPTKADEMTLRQLNDIAAMALSGKLPATNAPDAYNEAVIEARKVVDVSVGQSGHMQIKAKDTQQQNNLAFSFYSKTPNDTPSLSLMSDNAVTTQEAQIDFFAELDAIIDAVRNGTQGVDADTSDPRNIGMQNAIAKLDQLGSHVNKNLARTGVMAKSLQNVQERSQSMELSLKELKSELTDVDIAEAYMNLNQLSLNYQAILSSVTKINSLTLLNYMK
jgi:flagellar hook-associated protein 3 FlgL